MDFKVDEAGVRAALQPLAARWLGQRVRDVSQRLARRMPRRERDAAGVRAGADFKPWT